MTTQVFVCKQCDNSFKNKNSLGNHMRRFHPKTTRENLDFADSTIKRKDVIDDGKSVKEMDTDDNQSSSSGESVSLEDQPTPSSDTDKSSTNESSDTDQPESTSSDDTDSNSVKTNSSRDSESQISSDDPSNASMDTDVEDDIDQVKKTLSYKTKKSSLKLNKFKHSGLSSMKKILKGNNITPKKLKRNITGFNSINYKGVGEYSKVFELMKGNEIDRVLDNPDYIKILYNLFNGLKDGWIPICSLQVMKATAFTNDMGRGMYKLINKFKKGLSMRAMRKLIQSNQKLACDTFDHFNKPMMHYVDLYQDFMNQIAVPYRVVDYQTSLITRYLI